MPQQLVTFNFEGKNIAFDLSTPNVMVNATEMAKIFGKKINEFMSNESTKNFISECLKSGNSRFISIEKESDLYYSVQKSGTWMHRILALKFAAWLNPKFELWVYATIDDLLFGKYKPLDENLRQTALINQQIAELQKELQQSPTYAQIEALKQQARHHAKHRGTYLRTQIELFSS